MPKKKTTEGRLRNPTVQERKLVADIVLLKHRAARIGMHITAQAIDDAQTAAGWELAVKIGGRRQERLYARRIPR